MSYKESDDVLTVRTYPERVLIELRQELGDEFITIDHEGCVLHIGIERVKLGWDALEQLVDVIGVAKKTFCGKAPVTPK